jgi:hypothetical protein
VIVATYSYVIVVPAVSVSLIMILPSSHFLVFCELRSPKKPQSLTRSKMMIFRLAVLALLCSLGVSHNGVIHKPKQGFFTQSNEYPDNQVSLLYCQIDNERSTTLCC